MKGSEKKQQKHRKQVFFLKFRGRFGIKSVVVDRMVADQASSMNGRGSRGSTKARTPQQTIRRVSISRDPSTERRPRHNAGALYYSISHCCHCYYYDSLPLSIVGRRCGGAFSRLAFSLGTGSATLARYSRKTSVFLAEILSHLYLMIHYNVVIMCARIVV